MKTMIPLSLMLLTGFACSKASSACFVVENDRTVKINTVITFNGECSKNAQSFSWDFGDGTTTTGRVVTHSYDSIGNFAVMLTVNGPKDHSTHIQNIKVEQ